MFSRAEREWVLLEGKLTRARTAASNHPDPRCDEHADDDPIRCGWRAAYIEILEALGL